MTKAELITKIENKTGLTVSVKDKNTWILGAGKIPLFELLISELEKSPFNRIGGLRVLLTINDLNYYSCKSVGD